MKSQIETIKHLLNTQGFVSRNWALSNYVGRLASRIDDLRKEGYEFETFTVKNTKPDGSSGKDFVYKLKVKNTLF